jgi:FtsH-binding integral membrane protein
MQKVYGWMAVALVISGVTAYVVANNLSLVKLIFETGLFMPLLFLELGLVIGLSWLINKMNALTAIVLFVLYSFVTGLTLSVIFLVYQLGSITSIFGVSALIFGCMSAY